MPRAALTDDYAGLASGGGQPYRVGLVTHRIPMKDFLDRSFPPFLSFCWRDILQYALDSYSRCTESHTRDCVQRDENILDGNDIVNAI